MGSAAMTDQLPNVWIKPEDMPRCAYCSELLVADHRCTPSTIKAWDAHRPYTVACPVCGARPCNKCTGVPKDSVHAGRTGDQATGDQAIGDQTAGLGGETIESLGIQRWQYTVVNIGVFKSVDRMAAMLGNLGAEGWELAATMDKQSNWFSGMEKGFLLFKRPVPPGRNPPHWCITVRS